MKIPRAKVLFCHLRDALGESIPGEIKIDLKRNTNPVRTYVHECLHLKYPEWSETRVLKTEREIWKRMSNRQVFELGKRLFNRKWSDI